VVATAAQRTVLVYRYTAGLAAHPARADLERICVIANLSTVAHKVAKAGASQWMLRHRVLHRRRLRILKGFESPRAQPAKTEPLGNSIRPGFFLCLVARQVKPRLALRFATWADAPRRPFCLEALRTEWSEQSWPN
jgi:hypothetical protein